MQGPARGSGSPEHRLGREWIEGSPGEKHLALGRPYKSLPGPKEGYNKPGEGIFTRTCSDKTRGNDFNVKAGLDELLRKNSLQ